MNKNHALHIYSYLYLYIISISNQLNLYEKKCATKNETSNIQQRTLFTYTYIYIHTHILNNVLTPHI